MSKILDWDSRITAPIPVPAPTRAKQVVACALWELLLALEASCLIPEEAGTGGSRILLFFFPSILLFWGGGMAVSSQGPLSPSCPLVKMAPVAR